MRGIDRRICGVCDGECFRNGFASVSMDGQLACMESGFRVEDGYQRGFTCAAVVWCAGCQCAGVPVCQDGGLESEAACQDETHASLLVSWQEEILRDLVNLGVVVLTST